MEWTAEADDAIKKVPFFVRKRVRRRVETEASAEGKRRITLAEVEATRKRYLNNMASEIKGYRLDACFSGGGCPNRACDSGELVRRLENLFRQADLLTLLKRRMRGSLKFHHEFTVTVAECPNACSQPQIKDVGIIGAAEPGITDIPCTGCGECVDICREHAIVLEAPDGPPKIDMNACLRCGQCAGVCAARNIQTMQTGWRLLLGGKLGRHPQLARELPGIFTTDQVIDIVSDCIDFYKTNSRRGERFAALLTPEAFETFSQKSARMISDPDEPKAAG